MSDTIYPNEFMTQEFWAKYDGCNYAVYVGECWHLTSHEPTKSQVFSGTWVSHVDEDKYTKVYGLSRFNGKVEDSLFVNPFKK